ncbi:MAG: Fic family protein [bacterium]|nr:Fic family protein [bacterium]
MAAPNEKLAQSLEVLKQFQDKDGVAIIKSDALSRTHRERLLKNGFIKEVMKGWYISNNPQERKGESTSWYSSFWKFCSVYLNDRFEKDWCISPEQSILIHCENWTIPKQLLIRSSKASNNVTNLLFDTSLVDAALTMPAEKDIIEKNGIRIFSLTSALLASTPNFFLQNPIDARTALTAVKDASEILSPLLEGGNSVVAGRLAGAFRNIGRDRIADEIIKTMKAAGYDIRESDPFENKLQYTFTNRTTSPYVNRIKLMWQQMREPVLKYFPKPPGIPTDKTSYFKHINDNYKTDAYHSLSIEGYRVTSELIERVMGGNWNPNINEKDNEQKNALASRGYFLAFEAVKKSIAKIFEGENPGKVADDDHGDWYREMFSPSVTAGLLRPSDLAGYRNSQVFISNSNHIPMSCNGVRDAMPVLFEMLQEEKEPAVRAVLGHFIFVYIHPYIDGNGRIGRFLMNVMLASGGFPWTVIPLERRNDYMSALEIASVEQNINDFAKFIAKLVSRED